MMNKENETKNKPPPKDLETALEHIFNAATPRKQFVSQLAARLEQEVEGSQKKWFWSDVSTSIWRTASLGAAILALVFVLVWGINNLIPITEPGPAKEETPLPVIFTLTPTPPSLTSIPTTEMASPSPSLTLPVQTETPKPTRTPTETPYPTTTPDLAEMNFQTYQSYSPDGNWVAEGLVASSRSIICCPDYYTRLVVSRVDGSTQYVVVDKWEKSGLGYTTPRPFHWSSDGSYFYYTNQPVVEGCGIFVNGADLYKVDLRDGVVIEIIPSSGLWLSLSADESSLAYIGYAQRGLVLRDLATGEEREVSIDPGIPYKAGLVVWLPDESAVALTLAINPCFTDWADATTILIVDTNTLEISTLIEADERKFITIEWSQPDEILLKDENGIMWILNPVTGEVRRK
jgi:hypothetical protein